jgi:23S rRNA pseudouridine2605 synthase
MEKRSKTVNQPDENRGIRLNKFIANSGICSRRKADELIANGLVKVNGKVVLEMGFRVKREDQVEYNGKKVWPQQYVYVLLNKPKDFITTTSDEKNRKTVMDLVKKATQKRIYPVGRLDRKTTGLLLLTNDGELTQKLSHPSSEVKKLYAVTLDKPLKTSDLDKIREGLTLEDGDVKVDDIAYSDHDDHRKIGIELHVGKNRIVRRIFEHLGYDVKYLDRVIYAGLTKKDLPRGKWRFLTKKEVIHLKHFSS